MTEHDDPCFHCLYFKDSESCCFTAAEYCRELQPTKEDKKMTTAYDPCKDCTHETSACLLTQGECYGKKLAAQKEAEKTKEKKEEIVVNFQAADTD